MPINEPLPLLNTRELSAWLRIKESTLRKWVCYHRIPFLKLGRAVLFRRTDIEAWLAQENPQNSRWDIAPPPPSQGRYNPGVR